MNISNTQHFPFLYLCFNLAKRNKFKFPLYNPVENYYIRIIQCMFDKGLEKCILYKVQSDEGSKFNIQHL